MFAICFCLICFNNDIGDDDKHENLQVQIKCNNVHDWLATFRFTAYDILI